LTTLASTAHAARLLPRVEVASLTGPDWSVAVVGDPYMGSQLEQALFEDTPLRLALRRVPLWRLKESVGQLLEEFPLVVASLPQQVPRAWRPAAAVVFRTPVFVDHVLDLTVPLEETLRGGARQEVRQLIARSRRSRISRRCTREPDALSRFYEDLHVPYLVTKQGARALVSPLSTLQERFRRDDYELIELLHEDRLIAANLLSIVGSEARSEEAGYLLDPPPEVARVVFTSVVLAGIERARQRGCTTYRFGGSRALISDPVFRAKQRWGARTIPRGRLDHPEWTWLARELPTALADGINGLGLITFCGARPAAVRVAAGGAAPRAEGRLDGVDGWLLAGPGRSEFVPAEAGGP
jgi:hypothetical protein